MSTSQASETPITWDDLPPQPWPEATVAPPEALADWLTSLSREHLVWVLSRRQEVWSQDSECFLRNHEGQIADLQRQSLAVREVLDKHGLLPDSWGSPT